jgi:hypothetical protein
MSAPYGARPGWNSGVLGHINETLAVEAAGGTHVPVALNRQAFHDMLARYAPGCGSLIRISGTNGGRMPCGEFLTDMAGVRTQQLCYYCEQAQKMGAK